MCITIFPVSAGILSWAVIDVHREPWGNNKIQRGETQQAEHKQEQNEDEVVDVKISSFQELCQQASLSSPFEVTGNGRGLVGVEREFLPKKQGAANTLLLWGRRAACPTAVPNSAGSVGCDLQHPRCCSSQTSDVWSCCPQASLSTCSGDCQPSC